MMNNPTFNIFADGDNFVIFFKDGKSEMAYTFESPIITNIEIDMSNEIETVPLIKGKSIWKSIPKPDIKFEVNGACQAEKYKIESSDVGGLIPKLSIFKNVTVSELFFVINKKLNERKK